MIKMEVAMSEWKEYTIEDIAKVIGGGTPNTTTNEYWNGPIPWLTPKDLTGYSNTYISKGERSISEMGLAKSSARLLPSGTVLLTSRAPIGYVAIAKTEIATNQGFKNLVVRSNKANNIYIYYWVKANVDYLKQHGSGTTFAEISGSVLKQLEILLPPLPEQSAIASVLSSLDDKIDLLHRQNQTLEQMAETLHESWFEERELNSRISDLIELQNGYAFKSKSFQGLGENRVLKIKNISGGIVDIETTEFVRKEITETLDEKFSISTGDILFAMTGAKIGKMGIIPKTEYKLWLNQRVGLFKERYYGSRFLAYLHLKSDYGKDYIDNTATGSAQPNISGTGIENCEFPEINEREIIEYSAQLVPLFEKLIFNLGQIQKIEAIRNVLLPKLMSGEVRVKMSDP